MILTVECIINLCYIQTINSVVKIKLINLKTKNENTRSMISLILRSIGKIK